MLVIKRNSKDVFPSRQHATHRGNGFGLLCLCGVNENDLMLLVFSNRLSTEFCTANKRSKTQKIQASHQVSYFPKYFNF